MGNVESLVPVPSGETILPDGPMLRVAASEHGQKLQDVGAKLMEVHEKIQALSESGVLEEGVYIELSDKLRDAFKKAEEIENDSALNGAYNMGFAVLSKHPSNAERKAVCELLFDRNFCTALRNLKVELVRIHRGEPHSGPYLTAAETEWMEGWGKSLAEGAMRAWASFFSSLAWPRAWAVSGINDAEGPYDVPEQFRTLVCNLVYMQVNLWPTIKGYLDQWEVKGNDLFPERFWGGEYFAEVICLEPRMIPYIVGSEKIDMNELVGRGPGRRAGAQHRAAVDCLTPEQRTLVRAGVDAMREARMGRIKKQRPPFGGRWRAFQYKWPRENMPRERDLLGGTSWSLM